MDNAIDLEEIVGILKNQLKIIIPIKSDLIKLKKYEKYVEFKDYEKQIETQLETVQAKKSFPVEKQKVSKPNFSIESKKILEAINKKNEIIYIKDLTINIFNNSDRKLIYIFSKLGIKINELKKSLDNLSNTNDVISKEQPLFTLKALKAIYYSFLEIKLTKEKEVTPFTILLCILRDENDHTTQLLKNYGITYEKLFTVIRKKPTHNTV
jgi:nitrous oxide reductase